jgi:hypothetical protein
MELRRHLKEVEMGNGLANRFIWLHIERSKIIPSPKGVPAAVLASLIDELGNAFQFARGVGEMVRDPDAEALWAEVYPALSEGKPGLCGAITSRSEAQVLRLSMLYALMDCSPIIKVPHLQAALAFWDYSEQSVSLIFDDLLGDPNVDRVWDFLRTLTKLSRTLIHNILGRNASTVEVDRVASVLQTLGRAEWRKENGHDVFYPIKRR